MKKIISLLCAVAMMLSIASCGASEQPDAVVSRFCTAMQEFDFETMRDCMVYQGNDPLDFDDKDISNEIYEVLKEKAGSIQYTIEETTVSDDTGTVTVNFTYPDVSGALADAISDYISQALTMAFSGSGDKATTELFNEILLAKLKNAEEKTSDTTITFSCKLTEDGWKISNMENAVVNIIISNMLGGLESLKDTLRNFS